MLKRNLNVFWTRICCTFYILWTLTLFRHTNWRTKRALNAINSLKWTEFRTLQFFFLEHRLKYWQCYRKEIYHILFTMMQFMHISMKEKMAWGRNMIQLWKVSHSIEILKEKWEKGAVILMKRGTAVRWNWNVGMRHQLLGGSTLYAWNKEI